MPLDPNLGTRPITVGAGQWPLAITAALVGVALLLRVYRIGEQELWIDEAFTYYIASRSAGLWNVLVSEYSPPFYYLFMWVWVAAAGIGETSLRLPSAIFGAGFVLAVIWAGSTFFNQQVGFWAGGFTVLSPLHIYYSQESRGYSLVILLILLTTVLFWRALERNTWSAWAVVTLLATSAIYTHYFAALALAPIAGLIWVWSGRTEGPLRRWRLLGAMVVTGALVLPWLAYSVAARSNPTVGTGFIEETWENTPPLLAIPKTLELFALGSRAGDFPPFAKVYPQLTYPEGLRLMGLGVFLMLAVWVTVPWMDDELLIPELAKRKIWLGAMLLTPLAGLWLLSSLVQPIYYVGRYDFIAFPAFALLVGLGLAKLQAMRKLGAVLWFAIMIILLVTISYKLIRYFELSSIPPKNEASPRMTAQVLSETVQDGDVVVFTGLRGLPVLYYLERLGFNWEGGRCEERRKRRHFGCRMFPRETEEHPALYDSRRVMGSPVAVEREVSEFIAQLGSLPTNKLWLVFAEATYHKDEDGQAEILAVPAPDTFLVGTLETLGFRLAPHERLGVVVFQATQSVTPSDIPQPTSKLNVSDELSEKA